MCICDLRCLGRYILEDLVGCLEYLSREELRLHYPVLKGFATKMLCISSYVVQCARLGTRLELSFNRVSVVIKSGYVLKFHIVNAKIALISIIVFAKSWSLAWRGCRPW
ncbi:hypothetical protein EJ02DRAFT_459216 [Clathrospora elynae]|uniref:Uncharacterized protein n=1 Tax=Clathrospora elynae TaxID=706981 RepID=A0A6A5SE98_9PLEO|nr:hypothetical protein EJ02DRAFT_459216 [Clathrospora elynae]